MIQNRVDISSFTLKIVAIVGMACNHVANAFFGELPLEVTFALFSVGGITFPIMAFLITEGYTHTSNYWRYLGRLVAFAAISQIPYSLLWGAEGSVMITLSVGLVLLKLKDGFDAREQPFLVKIAAVAMAFMLIGATAWCDWGLVGPIMILLFSLLRNEGAAGILKTMLVPLAGSGVPALLGVLGLMSGGGASIFTLVCQIGYCFCGFSIATVLMLGYHGRQGHPLKWLFYAFYPAHLIAIWALQQFF